MVDKIIELDQAWRNERFELDNAKMEFNKINKEIGKRKKAKEDSSDLESQSKSLKVTIAQLEQREKDATALRDKTLFGIGNLVHDSVPIDDNEDNNVILRTWGEPRAPSATTPAGETYPLRSHYDLVQLLDIASLTEGQDVAGGRGYFLRNEGVFLNQALINFALGFLYKKGHMPLSTPYFMRQSLMGKCAQLGDFDEQLYKVTGEGEDKYLIATSEQPLCGMLEGKWFERQELPQKFAGFSTCFRKEAGSHGRDTLGIFRVHQFEKVEQFAICTNEGDASWQLLDELLANAEEFYQALGLPYRVVNIVSGALNDAAAKKYDLEAHFPASGAFRELVSCSNCTDFQSRNLEVRIRTGKSATGESQKAYAHLLNSTLVAAQRTVCCILENYQEKDGVRIPEALQPYTHGITFIPYRKALDKKGTLQDLPPQAIQAAMDAALGAAPQPGPST